MSQDITIYNTEDGKASVSLMTKDGNVWMNQNQLAELFDTSKQNISLHVINILEDKELEQDSVVKDYLTTALGGKEYNIPFLSPRNDIGYWFKCKFDNNNIIFGNMRINLICLTLLNG